MNTAKRKKNVKKANIFVRFWNWLVSLFTGKSKLFSRDIGIDLGTASVLVYVQGKGIVIKEPSVVAIDVTTDRVIKVGREAQVMLGRTPANIVASRPLREGVISQYEVTLKMMEYFIRKACGNAIFSPRVIVCVPSGITEVEERAVKDAAIHAGASRTCTIEEPLAAAIGAGLNIYAPVGNMVVDIGGGTTDIAVISLGGIVVSDSIKVAGDKFDEAIRRYVRRKYSVLLGENTAEMIKRKIGAVYDHKEPKIIDVKGRCVKQGLPKVIKVSSKEMIEALSEPVTAIIDSICGVIEKTPPELVGDILRNGIVMTGGGSLIYGFDKLIEKVTGIKTYVAKDAVSCVAIGTGKALENFEELENTQVSVSKRNQNRRR